MDRRSQTNPDRAPASTLLSDAEIRAAIAADQAAPMGGTLELEYAERSPYAADDSEPHLPLETFTDWVAL